MPPSSFQGEKNVFSHHPIFLSLRRCLFESAASGFIIVSTCSTVFPIVSSTRAASSGSAACAATAAASSSAAAAVAAAAPAACACAGGGSPGDGATCI